MAQLSDIIRVFVSSKQREFAEERRGMAEVVSRLPLLAVDIAEDWAPARETIEQSYVERVRRAPIYVGLFGCTYSEPTAHEYRVAAENPHREVLTYVKRCDEHRVEAQLAALIREFDEPQSGHTTKRFDNWTDLRPHFEQHLWAAVHRMIENYLRLAEPAPVARSGGSVMADRFRRERAHLLGLGLPGSADPDEARQWADALRMMVSPQTDRT
jgi:hypothetical protein